MFVWRLFLLSLVYFFASNQHCVESSLKILCIYPTVGRSHWIIGSSTAKALAASGHEVTMISPFPLKKSHPNYHDIELTGLLDNYNGLYVLTQI